MILPTKHIRISESLLGLSGYLLKILHKPMSVDELWIEFTKHNNKKIPAYHSFDSIILALDLLFMMGIIELNEKEELHYVSN